MSNNADDTAWAWRGHPSAMWMRPLENITTPLNNSNRLTFGGFSAWPCAQNSLRLGCRQIEKVGVDNGRSKGTDGCGEGAPSPLGVEYWEGKLQAIPTSQQIASATLQSVQQASRITASSSSKLTDLRQSRERPQARAGIWHTHWRQMPRAYVVEWAYERWLKMFWSYVRQPITNVL